MEQTDPRDLLVRVVKILERLNIHYLITGGIAVFVWGRPRFTADIDIVVELHSKDLDRLETALRQLSAAGYIDKEMMEEALERRGEFNFIDGETGVKVDFWVAKEDALARSEFKRMATKTIKGHQIYFISPEDLILRKLQWHKESRSAKQLEDVESILKISGKKLDKKYLKRWAFKISVWNTLQKLF